MKNALDPSADIDFLRGLGFEIVCEIEEGFIIVATEDVIGRRGIHILNILIESYVEFQIQRRAYKQLP